MSVNVQNPIRTWAVGSERPISLFLEPPDRFAFSVDGKKSTFGSDLYAREYAVNLTLMFHRTIGVNLAREKPHSSCFLPRLCSDVPGSPGVQAALFGRCLATLENPRGALSGMRWGVYDSSTREEQTFEIQEDDGLAREFIRGAPSTNKPHLEPVLDSRGQQVLDRSGHPIMQEVEDAPDHYALTAYAKRFSIVVDRESVTERIQSIALKYVSLLDRSVVLTENQWAVTLVSAQRSSNHNLGIEILSRVGHAMLACEGLKEGVPFLRYIHATQNPREKNPELKNDEAQIESFDKTTPLNSFNGPTWSRPRVFVDHMLKYVEEMRGVRVKFALTGTYFESGWADRELRHRIFGYRSVEEMGMPYGLLPEQFIPSSCLNWSLIMASECGIYVYMIDPLIKPIDQVKILRSAPTLRIPNGIDSRCLGDPLSGENAELAGRMLNACVIFFPEDCPPDQNWKWRRQCVIEDFEEMRRRSFSVRAAAAMSGLWARLRNPSGPTKKA